MIKKCDRLPELKPTDSSSFHAFKTKELPTDWRSVFKRFRKCAFWDAGIVLFHAKVDIIVKKHSAGFCVGVVHSGVQNTPIPQQGITRFAYEFDMIGHVSYFFVGGYFFGRPFVTAGDHAERGRGFIYVVDEEKDFDF